MNRQRFLSRTNSFVIVLVLFILLMSILVEVTPLGDNVWLRIFFGVSALNFTVRFTVPLVLGALSGILCERSGIINIGIEGMMLAGAFAAFTAKVATNSWPLAAESLRGRGRGAAGRRPHGRCSMRPSPSASAWTRLSPAR